MMSANYRPQCDKEDRHYNQEQDLCSS